MELPSPLRWLLELLSVACLFAVAYIGALWIAALCFVLLIFTPLWPIVVLYIGWVVLFDRNTPTQGGRPQKAFLKNLSMWDHLRGYFSMTLKKTSDLDPMKNYIFGYHPHGFISIGAVVGLQSDALGFSRKFPGIIPHMTVMSGLFKSLLYRDILLNLGFLDVGKDSLKYALTKMGPGHSVTIIVGGAAEVIHAAQPDTYYLTLKRRKGFIRLALETGSDLVPVFGFGNNNTCTQLGGPGSLYWRFQHWFADKMRQRGIPLGFCCCYGFLCWLPWRTPINVVVGSPIQVTKTANPTADEVNELHAKYIEDLATLFTTHRDQYNVPPQTQLNIFD